MALTNATQTFLVVAPFESQSLTLGNALDRDREAMNRVLGGPDAIATGTITAAETVNNDIPLTTLLGGASVSGVTRFVVKACVSLTAAAVANAGYWEVYQMFQDIAGTVTAVGTQVVTVAIEGGATTDPTLTISSTNLRVAVSGLAAVDKSMRVELFVTRLA